MRRTTTFRPLTVSPSTIWSRTGPNGSGAATQIASGESALANEAGGHSTNFVKFSRNAALTSYSDGRSAAQQSTDADSTARGLSRRRKRAAVSEFLRSHRRVTALSRPHSRTRFGRFQPAALDQLRTPRGTAETDSDRSPTAPERV